MDPAAATAMLATAAAAAMAASSAPTDTTTTATTPPAAPAPVTTSSSLPPPPDGSAVTAAAQPLPPTSSSSTAPSLPKQKQEETIESQYYPMPIPVRVDVTSDDKSTRVIDTLLIDPTCWPIPLYEPLKESVEANVVEYAHTILSDMEVHGMGRTVRHFTNRVDLYTPALQTKIEDQLRPQLFAIATGNLPKPRIAKNGPTKIYLRLYCHGVTIQEDLYWDCSVPFSPFDFAKDMAKEWNLPDQAVVPIATAILEQLYFDDLEVDHSPDVVATYTSTTDKLRRGAWMTDHKERVALTGQLISDYRSEQ